MQNAASYTRECGTKRLRAPDRHIESWRLCSPAAPTSALNSSHMDSIPTSNADRKMLGLPRTRGLIFYQSDYDKVKNLVYENFLPALNEETVGWSMPSYCNLTLQPANGTPNSLCQGFKTTQYDARKAKLHVNVHSEEFETECYNTDQAAAVTVCDQTHSISEDFLTAGSGRKIEEIARLNGISLQTASTKPSFEWSNVITEETAPRDLQQAFARQMDECKESPPTEYKRTSSAFDGDQASPSKRIRTSDALLKVQVRVRKEKLGERITVLQQLVSPFGKTDTASVLLETIGYIKFLQDQVQVLSTPYVTGFASSQIQDGSAGDSEISELRRRGLCVMPLSCTQLVANNNGAIFWASGIGDGPRV